MEITVNLKLTAEPDFLDILRAFVKPFTNAPESAVKETPAMASKAQGEKKNPPVKNETIQEAPIEKTEHTTIEQVRAVVSAKTQAGVSKDTIKEMLAKYEVKNLTALKKENYADFINDLNEL